MIINRNYLVALRGEDESKAYTAMYLVMLKNIPCDGL